MFRSWVFFDGENGVPECGENCSGAFWRVRYVAVTFGRVRVGLSLTRLREPPAMKTIQARIAVAITTVLVFAACGESPATLTAPETPPSFDGGGLTFGGGNRSDTTTTTTTTATQGGDAAVEGGGLTFGGGN